MRKIIMTGFLLLVSFFLVGGIQTSAEMDKNVEGKKVELTEQQKQELDVLYKELLETKKTLLNKYVEYGVLSKEKADKKLAWLEEHYQKVKEHGYVPMHHHKKHDDKDEKEDND
ncbi:DUF2680 domain-containing protein [Ferdinandcohnia sp. Marseille-Q9671]